MKDIVYFTLIIFIAYGLGRAALLLFIKTISNLLEDFIFSTGVGLASLGFIVYTIGSFGFLYQKCILTVLGISAAIAVCPVYRFLFRLKNLNIFKAVIKLSLLEKFLILVLFSIPVICLFGVLAPETGNDALAYHLYHPKIFIENHHIGHISLTRESLWPYLRKCFLP
jgi:hypothetical protein